MLIGAIGAILVIYVIAQYNILIKAKNSVKEAFSTMDVYLKKRWDLIPNLVETVKKYAEHESGTFEKITSLRAEAYDSMSVDKKIDVNTDLSPNITKIMAVSENYPELKANENFLALSNDLNKVEEDIANSRKYYNGTVKELNNIIQMFPGNIVASMFGFKQVNSFEVNEEERNNVKVSI